jgi:hypothetical protein
MWKRFLSGTNCVHLLANTHGAIVAKSKVDSGDFGQFRTAFKLRACGAATWLGGNL